MKRIAIILILAGCSSRPLPPDHARDKIVMVLRAIADELARTTVSMDASVNNDAAVDNGAE